MSSIGRNDACPCGSGLKYKKCCLFKNQPDDSELKRRRLGETQAGLIKKIGRYASEVYGPDAIDEAYEEFHMWEIEGEFARDSKELPIFMPYYFYQWFPDPESTMCEYAPSIPPALSLAETDKSLSSDQRNYLIECCRTGFSFFEITDVEKDKSLDLKDLLTESLHHVIERSATENVKVGDLVFGKVITIDGIGILEACAPLVIPPQFKIEVIDLRKFINKKVKVITDDVLNEYSIEILELYREIYNQLMNPKPKVITNTDGELFTPHKLIFEIEDSSEVFDALHSLDFNNTKDELLADAKVDKVTGKIKSVEFPWLHKGNKSHKDWENTVWGHIKIESQKMTVEVNSKERAKKFQTELKKRLLKGWNLKTTLIEPIEAKLKKMDSGPLSPKQLETRKESDELMKHPEVIKQMEKMMKSHWDNWINKPVPALDGKKPTDAAKTKIGREKLEALLNQFERNAERNQIAGQTVDTIKELRVKLGLER